MLSLEEVKSFLDRAGQSHVLQFWSELSEEERKDFLLELSGLDLNVLKRHCEEAVSAAASQPERVDPHIEPVTEEFVGSVLKSDKATLVYWENEGILSGVFFYYRRQPS